MNKKQALRNPKWNNACFAVKEIALQKNGQH